MKAAEDQPSPADQEEPHGVSRTERKQRKGKEGSEAPRAEGYPNCQQALPGKLLRAMWGELLELGRRVTDLNAQRELRDHGMQDGAEELGFINI